MNVNMDNGYFYSYWKQPTIIHCTWMLSFLVHEEITTVILYKSINRGWSVVVRDKSCTKHSS